MKIQFLAKNTETTEDYWEDARTQENETPKECAERIVKYFNATLREGELPRKLLDVRVVQDDIKMKRFIVKVIEQTESRWIIDAETAEEAQSKYSKYDESDFVFISKDELSEIVEVVREFEEEK